MATLEETIRQAKNSAAAVAAAPTTLPAVQAEAQVPATPAPGRNFTMDDLASGTMNVDKWLKVKEHGLEIDGKLITAKVPVVIDMPTVGLSRSVKFGNPARYLKTYNGVTCTDGSSWAQAQEIARKAEADPKKHRPYPTADITMITLEEVKAVDGSTVVPAGTRLGYTTSTTGFAYFKTLYDEVKKLGLLEAEIVALIGSEARTNPGHRWGVVTFEFVSRFEMDEVAEAAE